MRFGYSTINWGETPDMAEALGEIHAAGWRAVELFAHPLDWLGPPAVVQGHLGGLRAASLFGTVHVPTSPAGGTKLRRQIDYCAALGAEAFGLVGGGRPRWRPPTPEEETDLATFCDDLAHYGADRGVVVAYHPHVACTVETEDEIDRLMERTRVLTLCLDPSHIALVGEDPLHHLRKYRERTGYIHLKDWARGKFVEMGQGTIGIDFTAILDELARADFPGWVIVEQSRSDVSPHQSALTNAAYLRTLGYDPATIGGAS